MTALFGRSGAGKSTIAQGISGVFAPTEGHIALNEEVLFSTDQVNRPAHRRGIGYVFQQICCFRIFRCRAIWNMHNDTAATTGTTNLSEVLDILGIDHLLHRRQRGYQAVNVSGLPSRARCYQTYAFSNG